MFLESTESQRGGNSGDLGRGSGHTQHGAKVPLLLPGLTAFPTDSRGCAFTQRLSWCFRGRWVAGAAEGASAPRRGGGGGAVMSSGQSAWGDCTVSQLGVAVPELRTMGVGDRL